MQGEINRLRKECEGWRHEAENRLCDLNQAHDELSALRATTKKDVWYWQGDKYDEPESLTCPVVMQPNALRALLEVARTNRPAQLESGEAARAKATLKTLDEIRNMGWNVGVHNDYLQNGMGYTFWLFTHPNGKYVKGEGLDDHSALLKCREAITNLEITHDH